MAIVQSSVLYNGILQSHVLYIHVLLSNHRTTDISTYHHSTQYCTSLPHVPNLSPSISLLSWKLYFDFFSKNNIFDWFSSVECIFPVTESKIHLAISPFEASSIPKVQD